MKCPKRTEGSMVDPECYWPFVPTLWESLSVASTQAGPLNLQVRSSGVKRITTCRRRTLSAGSRSLSLRLSQHHHNEQWSAWSWVGGKVCRHNSSGKIVYRRPSQDSAAGRKRETISGRQSQSESLSPWGSWGAVRRTIQRDENCRA